MYTKDGDGGASANALCVQSRPGEDSEATETPEGGAVGVRRSRISGGSSAEGALDTHANKVSPPWQRTPSEPGADKRFQRFEGRYWLWKFSRIRRVSFCGRVTTSSGGGVGVRHRDGRAGFAGLQSCGSVWACPVCNAKIMARRALELGAAVESWTSTAGQAVAFMTFTIRHSRRDSLASVWDAVASAWRAAISGKCWISDQVRYGVEGFTRVTEVTHGANGWHVHLHVLVYLHALAGAAVPGPGPAKSWSSTSTNVAGIGPTSADSATLSPTAESAAALQRSMYGRWRAACVRAGLGAPLLRGQDVRLVTRDAGREHLAKYLAKAQYAGIAREMTASQGKRARSVLGTRSTWELLADAVNGLDDGVRLWAAWEVGSRGRRQIGWSRGLRQRLGLGLEDQDEAIAAEELGSADDTAAIITAQGWAELVRIRQLVECLRSVELGGVVGLHGWLNEHGIEHELTNEGNRDE